MKRAAAGFALAILWAAGASPALAQSQRELSDFMRQQQQRQQNFDASRRNELAREGQEARRIEGIERKLDELSRMLEDRLRGIETTLKQR